MTTFNIPELRYGFKGKFEVHLFSLRKDLHPGIFDRLESIMNSISGKFDTYNPLNVSEYKGMVYMNLNLRGDLLKKLKDTDKGCLFSIQISFTLKEGNNGKKYVNVYADKLELVKKCEQEHGGRGEALKLEF